MSEKVRVLIIDDEASVRDILRHTFPDEKFDIREAVDGRSGLDKLKSFHPNLILLDLRLPDVAGFSVLKEIRSWTQVPVIVLTVDDSEETKVRLLDAGADDYLTKPFGASELLARVRLALRHTGNLEATPVFISSDLRVDLNQRSVSVDGNKVKLTKTEFELLQRLIRDSGKVVPQNKLLKEIWGIQAQEESHYLRIYIKQLRKKIEKDPSSPKHIITDPGVGYRII